MTIEPFDHTADIGVDLEAGSLEELYAEAAAAFTDAIADLETVRQVEQRQLQVAGEDRETLMVAWLEELLFCLDTEQFLVSRAEIELGELEGGRLELRAWVAGERFDPDRHPANVAIKGVTYHQLEVRQDGDRWRARVIFDI